MVIWPIYFDSTKTRKEGRRVPKTLAVSLPKILEIKDAVEKLGLEYELMQEASYSKTPWVKTGMLLVKKSGAKEEIIGKVAKQLLKIRSVAVKED
jgi:signal recognition particle subunit SRP19